MKQFLLVVTVVAVGFATSCDRATVAPLQANVMRPAAGNPDSIPQTIHVIPFYDYSPLGYSVGGRGGSGGLIGGETALYGATVDGGDTKCSARFYPDSNAGCGIVYRLVPNSTERKYRLDILHTFKGAPRDGAASFATLLADKSGDLYGTTFYGGKYDGGTIFKLHPASSSFTETIVHSFGLGHDGLYPVSGVIEVNGVLYGTTIGGGTHTDQALCGSYGGVPNGTCGTVYSVDPSTGAERVLHSFGKTGDGANPFAALLDVDGTLYGTTAVGGSSYYCGTVFSIGSDGKGERVVHSFLNATQHDGCSPFASLLNVGGTVYGTTCCGGGNFCGHCEGTIFSVDLSTGKEQVLHEFGASQDGSEPVAALIDVRGVLYGTTSIGGQSSCLGGDGCGIIFSLAPFASSPAYNVLYQFKGKSDGAGPEDALLYSNGRFYGTTTSAGKNGLGTGVKLRR